MNDDYEPDDIGEDFEDVDEDDNIDEIEQPNEDAQIDLLQQGEESFGQLQTKRITTPIWQSMKEHEF